MELSKSVRNYLLDIDSVLAAFIISWYFVPARLIFQNPIQTIWNILLFSSALLVLNIVLREAIWIVAGKGGEKQEQVSELAILFFILACVFIALFSKPA